MKVIVIFTVIIALASAEWRQQTSEDLSNYRTECAAKLKIADEKVAEFKKWNFTDDLETHCYIKCIFEHMLLFNEETGPIVENLVQQLGYGVEDKEPVRQKIIGCVDSNPNNDDKCTWAFRGFTCFRQQNLSLIQASLKKD